MPNYRKPDMYSDADWEMVQGYMAGKDGLRAQRSNAAYMHGYRNGVSDRIGIPHERAEVLRRRAEMIPGITPREEILHG
ncbi:hypothetical protein APA66_24410 [Pseudomonas aeruginosa]|uniref:Uncharacterized protein n=1 Tax=Pseudomonas phage PP9W2 TaxID=2914450 RepID=A0A9E7CDB7_9CAUD|nr:hypothetical protein [Pseudomonas aeruginosa]YP_010773375.1 hypothetical protein QIT84_gp082 [Pseudomonas phage PP9W2]KRV12948.1 hypothetical protein AN458_28465 [Pseudomonas aeruginosa]KSE32247.1 hypothetical protein AO916_14920 [Pseudomonas aeruginosa]KSM48469.1 hypothetical protein APA66_24410 [Pseudomonas aeruginosa]KSQ92851.1 hypothetical protein APB42_17475 [Pseudomonas aeruginosa]QZD64636.1 hypothetical protein K3176_00975 [Pseudomonas aeruginosa]